jgi:hypothetical protein
VNLDLTDEETRALVETIEADRYPFSLPGSAGRILVLREILAKFEMGPPARPPTPEERTPGRRAR